MTFYGETEGSIPPDRFAFALFLRRDVKKTLTNFVFSESLINEDYHTVFIERKKSKDAMNKSWIHYAS